MQGSACFALALAYTAPWPRRSRPFACFVSHVHSSLMIHSRSPRTPNNKVFATLIIFLIGGTYVRNVRLACWLTRHRIFATQALLPHKLVTLHKLGNQPQLSHSIQQKILRRHARCSFTLPTQ